MAWAGVTAVAAVGGLGLGVVNAMSGGGSVPLAQKPPLHEEDKAFRKKLHAEIEKDMSLANKGMYNRSLTSPYLGQMYQMLTQTSRSAKSQARAAMASGEPGAGGGAQMLGGFLAQAQHAAIPTQMAQMRNTATRDLQSATLERGKAIWSSEMGIGAQASQVGMQQSLLGAKMASQQGEILGNLAQMGALMYALPKIERNYNATR